jgi:hypothetical protein
MPEEDDIKSELLTEIEESIREVASGEGEAAAT